MQAMALNLNGRDGIDLILASKGEDGAIGWLQQPRHGQSRRSCQSED
jgi:hypothetical protein